ncbi:hypothetical protein PENTCL1PPCAC_18901, partial [Pristionchus entomophagus]
LPHSELPPHPPLPPVMQISVALSLLLVSLSVVLSSAAVDDEYAAALGRRFLEDIRRQGAVWAPRTPSKRAPHQIEARALNQFKNCYFSPIQCVLMERRRK